MRMCRKAESEWRVVSTGVGERERSRVRSDYCCSKAKEPSVYNKLYDNRATRLDTARDDTALPLLITQEEGKEASSDHDKAQKSKLQR